MKFDQKWQAKYMLSLTITRVRISHLSASQHKTEGYSLFNTISLSLLFSYNRL